MLIENCKKYYDKSYNLNCAECILYAANDEYGLGLDKKDFKLAAGFGGGMAVEGTCGALTGAIMVLGLSFVNEKAHESDKIKILTKEMVERFTETLKSINCKELKALYRDDQKRCFDIIKSSAEILDDIIKREKNK